MSITNLTIRLLLLSFILFAHALDVEDVTDKPEPTSNSVDYSTDYGLDRDLEHPDEYQKQLYAYDTVTPECNFFMD
jgi:hypothetical protein